MSQGKDFLSTRRKKCIYIRSGSDRECKYFPIGMNAHEPLWR